VSGSGGREASPANPNGLPLITTVIIEVGMKKVIFAVLLTALALFLIVPNLSWAF